MSEFSHEGAELINDSASVSADLQIVGFRAETRRMKLPSMSDDELYLRINVPDGLENNGKWPTSYQPEVVPSMDDRGSSIRHDVSE